MADAPAQPSGAPTRFRPRPPVVIGLLGGVAAGKTAVAAAFAAHGLLHVDADQLARTATAQSDVLAAITAAFGAQVRGPGGELDRTALARIVFADPAARLRLEAITHPVIRRLILERVAAARAAGDSVLLDVPLLLEGGLIAQCDTVVFVHAGDEVRAARARGRGWDRAEWQRREAAQAPLAQKQARADHQLDNDAPLPAVQRQVADLLQRLLAPRGGRP